MFSGNKAYFERRWSQDHAVRFLCGNHFLSIWWFDRELLDKAAHEEEDFLKCQVITNAGSQPCAKPHKQLVFILIYSTRVLNNLVQHFPNGVLRSFRVPCLKTGGSRS